MSAIRAARGLEVLTSPLLATAVALLPARRRHGHLGGGGGTALGAVDLLWLGLGVVVLVAVVGLSVWLYRRYKRR
jgi:hypothetical protein